MPAAMVSHDAHAVPPLFRLKCSISWRANKPRLCGSRRSFLICRSQVKTCLVKVLAWLACLFWRLVLILDIRKPSLLCGVGLLGVVAPVSARILFAPSRYQQRGGALAFF